MENNTPIEDIEVIDRAMLDSEHAAKFDKPWLAQEADGTVHQFDTNDAACEFQRTWRQQHGLDPISGEMGESSVMTIIDLKNSYLDAAADLRAKQADLANHADELHRFIAVRDQLQAHPDFSGYLPETYYSGGDLDPVGAKPEHEARHSSPSPGM